MTKKQVLSYLIAYPQALIFIKYRVTKSFSNYKEISRTEFREQIKLLGSHEGIMCTEDEDGDIILKSK